MAGEKLSDVARHIIEPDGITATGWPSVRDTCERIGWSFDGWQDGAGRLILAKREDGLYAADTAVLSIPRQVGKTYLIAAMAFALCLLEPNLTVVWTAHRFKTARETFSSMKAMATKVEVAPHIDRVSNARGEEAVAFGNGSRIMFGARERGFGRGFAEVDVLILDEGQILTESAMEDMIPATNAARNALVIMPGTPPRPKDPGEIFTLLRQEALEGESSGTLYIEFSSDRGCELEDREQWKKANPSFPHRTSDRAIERMRKNLPPESFKREALGIWDEFTKQTSPIPATAWTESVDVGPEPDTRPRALAVDMSHERHISVAGCWLEGESAHVEEVLAGPDPDAVVEWIVRRAGRRIPVVIDSASPAAALAPILRARRVHVKATSAPDMARACGQLVDKLGVGRLTHADQDPVNHAVKGARKRAIGTSGGWGYDRRDERTNIAPLVAITLALFGAQMSRRPLTSSRSSSSSEAAPVRRPITDRPRARAARADRSGGRRVISG